MPIPKVTSVALLSAINSGAIRGIAKTAKPLGSIHLYQSSLEGYRFGRGDSSGFLGGFRYLHWSGYGPVPRVRSCRFALSHERGSRCWDGKKFIQHFFDLY